MPNQKNLWDEEYKRKKNLWSRQTKSLPKILKNKIVLETGVGNGKTLIAILKQKPKSVTAIDFSSEAISICKKSFQDKSLELVQADITNLPFQDNSFDIIICYYIFNNLNKSKRKKASKELNRVLKTKGKIIFEDFADGDFRKMSDKLKFHHFTEAEINSIFSNFKKLNVQLKTSCPIFNKPHLKRKLIRALIDK